MQLAISEIQIKTTPIKTNKISFGLKNPKAAMNRALELKNTYKDYNIKYLLPNETWDNKKIAQFTKEIDNKIINLIQNNSLTIHNVQKILNKALPKINKNQIKIKNLSMFKLFATLKGFSQEQISDILEETEALQCDENNAFKNKSKIFISPAKIHSNNPQHIENLTFRSTFGHELKHALRDVFQNSGKSELLHIINNNKFKNFDNNIFSQFEKYFCEKINDENGYFSPLNNLNLAGLLEYLNINKEEALFKSFTENLENLIKNKTNKDLYYSSEFYKYCKDLALNEKLSYQTESIYREKNGSSNIPIRGELRVLLYSEMEKFFKIKSKTASVINTKI